MRSAFCDQVDVQNAEVPVPNYQHVDENGRQ